MSQTIKQKNAQHLDGLKTLNSLRKKTQDDLNQAKKYKKLLNLLKKALDYISTIKQPSDLLTKEAFDQIHEISKHGDTSSLTMRSSIEKVIHAYSYNRLRQKEGREQFIQELFQQAHNLNEGEALKSSQDDRNGSIATYKFEMKNGHIQYSMGINSADTNSSEQHLDPWEMHSNIAETQNNLAQARTLHNQQDINNIEGALLNELSLLDTVENYLSQDRNHEIRERLDDLNSNNQSSNL